MLSGVISSRKDYEFAGGFAGMGIYVGCVARCSQDTRRVGVFTLGVLPDVAKIPEK